MFAGCTRDLDADLWSNPLAAPVNAEPGRAFREGYVQTSIAVRSGVHEWWTGAEFVAARGRERFSYRISEQFEGDDDDKDVGGEIAAAFAFDGCGQSPGGSAVQDRIQAESRTFHAGLRWAR
jgi:hypothetical protein